MEKITKTAMITVCGRPNVGKSSLTNALVGEKIAIVSDKPQTTRNRIYGVVNRGGTQYVLLDTPGLHKPRSRLGDYMVKVVRESLSGRGVRAAAGGAHRPCGRAGAGAAPAYSGGASALPCCVSTRLTRWRRRRRCWRSSRRTARRMTASMPSSPSPPRTGDGLDDLMAQLAKYCTEGPRLFPDGMTTDQPEQPGVRRDRAGEDAAVPGQGDPHGTAVEVTRFSEREDSGIIDLDVTIYCEKASHKGIIIGKGGEMLKRISSLARRDIEKFMGTKVYMETWVKVKENWRDNVNFIRSQGYNEE